MLKKSLIGLVVVALAGGGYFGYSQYQAKVEADKRKVATDIKKAVIEQRKNQLVKLKEQRAEKEKEAEFAKVHYPKVLNGTGTIETKEFIDEKGIKRAEYQLVDGNIGGKYILWRKDGTKQEEGFLLTAKGYEDFRFIQPLYFDERSEFNKRGFLEEKRTYNSSGKKLSYQSFYPSGVKRQKNESGKSIFWYQNGQLMAQYSRNSLGLHGWAEYWYPNGVRKCEGEFDSSGLWASDYIGDWKLWNEEGELIAEGYFSDNKIDSTKPHLGSEKEIKDCSDLTDLFKIKG